MKKQLRCKECEESIKREPEIWIKGKRVCEKCYWKFKNRMNSANFLYKKYGDLSAYDELIKEDKKMQ